MQKKSIAFEIVLTVAVAISALVLAFVLLLFLLFSGINPAIQNIIGVCYAVGVAFLIWLIYKKRLPKKVWRIGVYICCGAIAASFVYAAPKIYEGSLPTLSELDNHALIAKYQPHRADSQAVQLNEPSALALSGDLPRIDCATALYPVAAAFAGAAYPAGNYDPYESALKCSGTPDAYASLILGNCDVIFVAGPSDAQLADAQKKGVQFKLTPIGKEAFVFFVSAQNPVDTLSVEQVQSIYSGDVTNWSALGGPSQEIRAFQRDEGSGSQTALLKLMKGKTLMKAPNEDVVDGMGGIIRQVADYKNYPNAIGYSFRFYSTEMVKNNQIKLLALNGVLPDKQTIADGTYPLTSQFYAVTVEGRETQNTTRLVDWALSPQGQYLIGQTGYVPVS